MAVLTQPIRSTEGGPNQVYLPSQNPVNGAGVPLFHGGQFYVQYGASTAIANSTVETSLLNNSSTTVVGFFTQGSAAAYPGSTLTLNAGMLSLGTIFQGKVVGIISNTGTPTATVRLVLKNPSTGSVVYTVNTSGAVTTVSTLSNSTFEALFEWIVTATGSSGSVTGRMSVLENATRNSNIAPAAVTVDTTQPYNIDVLFTWGTASASNTVTAKYASFGVLG